MSEKNSKVFIEGIFHKGMNMEFSNWIKGIGSAYHTMGNKKKMNPNKIAHSFNLVKEDAKTSVPIVPSLQNNPTNRLNQPTSRALAMPIFQSESTGG